MPKVHELLAGPIEAVLRDASLGKAGRAAALQQVWGGLVTGMWRGAAAGIIVQATGLHATQALVQQWGLGKFTHPLG